MKPAANSKYSAAVLAEYWREVDAYYDEHEAARRRDYRISLLEPLPHLCDRTMEVFTKLDLAIKHDNEYVPTLTAMVEFTAAMIREADLFVTWAIKNHKPGFESYSPKDAPGIVGSDDFREFFVKETKTVMGVSSTREQVFYVLYKYDIDAHLTLLNLKQDLNSMGSQLVSFEPTHQDMSGIDAEDEDMSDPTLDSELDSMLYSSRDKPKKNKLLN